MKLTTRLSVMRSMLLLVIRSMTPVLANNNCATPLNLLSSYPGKKSCDGGDQDFVEYMRGYPNRKCVPVRRQYYENNEVRPITVTKNEIKTITVDYYSNKSDDNLNNNSNNISSGNSSTGNNTNNNTPNNTNTGGSVMCNNKGSSDVTVTRFVVSTHVLEKPFTLFREVTTTITVEKPIINYKVTTFTETTTKIETRTVSGGSTREEVPKSIKSFEPNKTVTSDPNENLIVSQQQEKIQQQKSLVDKVTVTAAPQVSIVTVYASQSSSAVGPTISTVTVYSPNSIPPTFNSVVQNVSVVTVTATVNQISSIATPGNKTKKNCLDSKCITKPIQKGCEITMGQQGSKPKTICRFTNVPSNFMKKRNRRRTVVKTVYEKGGEEAENEGEDSTTKTVFV